MTPFFGALSVTPPLDIREIKGRKTAKTCRKCGEEKPVEEFRRNPRISDGLSSWCSVCHVAATRDWRRRNKELNNKRRRERYARQRFFEKGFR
jgi:hypothetical protein